MAQNEIKIKLNADTADVVAKFSQLSKIISDLTKQLQNLTQTAGISTKEITVIPQKVSLTPKKETYQAAGRVEYTSVSPSGEISREVLPVGLKATVPTAKAEAEQELQRKEKIYEVEKRLYQAGYQNSTIQSKIKELTKAQGTDFDVLLSKTKSLASEFEKNKRLNKNYQYYKQDTLKYLKHKKIAKKK